MAMLRNRLELAKFFNEQGFKVGAEIGVFAGYYSEVLCQAIPGLKLYCVDYWQAYPGYGDYMNQRRLDKAYAEAQERLKSYNAELIKGWSTEIAKDFKDGSLDFVYIDANHGYQHCYEDIVAWTPKVRKGGIVAGDDYYMTRSGNYGVIKAVHDFIDKTGYELQLTPWDLKDPAEDNRQPQWWFWKTK